MQSMGCFARAFALKTFNGIKHCGHLLWSEASMLHKDIYICCMKNRGILYVASSFVRGCGLKLCYSGIGKLFLLSSFVRGCGLKSPAPQSFSKHWMSSFVRGCGLKLFCFQLVFMGNMSSSMRGCGLKYGLCLPRRSHAGVILRARM